jgi:hypothetical protein
MNAAYPCLSKVVQVLGFTKINHKRIEANASNSGIGVVR